MNTATTTKTPPAVAPTPPDEPGTRGTPLSLSPSRASDFKSCPLLYRFRSIDRLPEPPSPAATRGTLRSFRAAVSAAVSSLFAEAKSSWSRAFSRSSWALSIRLR